MSIQTTCCTPTQDSISAATSLINAAAASPTEATPQQVQEMLAKGQAILVDVREPDEHARERISGAHLFPLSTFNPHSLLTQLKLGQKVVFHCRGGRRSTDAVRQAGSLAKSGIGIINMTGGLEAWKAANLPVEVSASVSSMSIMRQVQLVIGLCVLAGSALAWFANPLFIVVPAFFGAGLTFAGATGTCALASLIALMPWNRTATTAIPASGNCASGSCSTGSCEK